MNGVGVRMTLNSLILTDINETNDVNFRKIEVWANRFCVSDRVLFETHDGRFVDRDDINREERQFDHDYDIDWNDDWFFD